MPTPPPDVPYLPPTFPTFDDPTQGKPANYRDILRVYDEDRKTNPVFSQMTLPEYSAHMNEATGSHMFDAGTTTGFGGVLKRVVAAGQNALDYTQIPDFAEEGGRQLGQALQGDYLAEHLGKGARGAVEGLPALLPLLSAGPAGVPMLAAAGVSGLIGGSEAYTDTGSPAAGVVSGLTNAAFPTIFGKAGNFALKAAGATLKDEAGHLVGETLGQRLAGYAGGQAGGAALGEASHQVNSLVQGQGLDLSPSHFLDEAISQAPWLAFDLPGVFSSVRGTALRAAADTKAKQAAQDAYNASDAGQFANNTSQGTEVIPYTGNPFTADVNTADPRLTEDLPSAPKTSVAQRKLGSAIVPYEPSSTTISTDYPTAEESKRTLFGRPLLNPDVVTQVGSEISAERPAPVAGRVVDNELTGKFSVSTDVAGKVPEDIDTEETAPGVFTPPVEPSPVARQNRAYDQSRVSPTPLTQPAVDAIIKPIIEQPDMQKMVEGVTNSYNQILKPEFGMQDTLLDRMSDETIRGGIQDLINEGYSPTDAVMKFVAGIRNTLTEATARTQGKIFDAKAEEIMARIRAKKSGASMLGLQGINALQEYLELGVHLAKNLYRAGKVRFDEWRQSMHDAVPDITPQELSTVERHVSLHLGSLDEDGNLISHDRAKAEASMGSLNKLDDAFNARPLAQRQAEKSPLEKVAIWRNQLTDRPEFSKYPEVDEKLLQAAGNLRHDGQSFVSPTGEKYTDVQVKSYLSRAAQDAKKAAVKKAQGGEEPAYDEQRTREGITRKPIVFTDQNEAQVRVDEMNKAVPKNSDYSYVVSESNKHTPGSKKFDPSKTEYRVMKRYAKSVAVGEGTENHGLIEDDPEVGHQSGGPIELDENGEPVVADRPEEGLPVAESGLVSSADSYAKLRDEFDPTKVMQEIAKGVRNQSDQTSADIVSNHARDLVDQALSRLDPNNKAIQKTNLKVPVLVARTRLMVQHMMDTTQRLGTVENWERLTRFLNSRLAPEFQFSDHAQAKSWWNNTGEKFFLNWAKEQPELQQLNEARQKLSDDQEKVRARRLAMNQLKEEVTGAIRRGEVQVSQAMSATDMLRSTFARRGEGPAMAQRSTDAVQRILRAAAAFKGSEGAKVLAGELELGHLGAAVQIAEMGSWTPYIHLNSQIHSDSFMTMVAGHESFETLLHAIDNNEAPTESITAVKNILDTATSMSQDERATALKTVVNNLPKKVQADLAKDGTTLQGLLDYSAADPKEFASTLAGLHLMGSTDSGGASWFSGMMKWGDGAVSRMLNAVVTTAKGLVNAFKGVASAADAGFVHDVPEGLSAKLAHFDDLFSKVRNTQKVIDAAVGHLTAIDALTPEQFWQSVQSGVRAPIDTADPSIKDILRVAYAKTMPDSDPRKIGKAGYWTTDFIQLSHIHEVLKAPVSEMLDYVAKAEDAARNAASPFFSHDYVRNKVVPGEALKAVQRVAKDSKVHAAMDELISAEQFKDRFLDPAEIGELQKKHGMTAQDLGDVTTTRRAIGESNAIVGQQFVRAQRNKIMHNAALILVSGKDVSGPSALKAADILTDLAHAQAGMSTLGPGVTPESMMRSVSSLIGDPDKLMVAQQLIGEGIPLLKNLSDLIESKPHFVTETRYGRYSAQYDVEGSKLPGRVSGDSMREVEKKLNSIKASRKVSNITYNDNSDNATAGLSPRILEAMTAIGKAGADRVAQTLGGEAARGAYAAIGAFEGEMQKELNARGIERLTQKRQLREGRETIDMLGNAMRYIATVPRVLEKGWLRDRMEVMLNDPQLAANPSAQNAARQQTENILSTDAPWARKAKEWSALYFVGANLSTAAVEFLQPIQGLPAELISRGDGIAQAFGRVAKGFGAVAGAYQTGKFADPFVDRIMHRLDEGSITQHQTIGNMFDNNDLNSFNLSRSTDGIFTPLGAAQVGANAVAHVTAIARNILARTSGLAARVTGAAAAFHAKDLVNSGKLDENDAYNYVRDIITSSTPGTGGKVQKPVGIYSSKATRSAVGVLMSMQGYTVSMTSMMGRMALKAVQSGELTSAHSKAFAVMLGTQLAMAGVLGLPAVGTAINILNSMFPDAKIKPRIREAIANLAGDDAHLGGLISDITTRGIANTLTGVDLSTRFSLADMMGVSAYDGFSMGNLLGAPGNILSNLFNSANLVSQGKYGQAFQTAAPSALRNIVQLSRGGGDIRKPDGSLVYQPNLAEQLAKAVGFTPKKVADMSEFAGQSAQIEQAAQHEQDRFLNRTAQMLQDGDMAGVRSALVERERAMPGEFNSAEGLKAVVQKMQDRTYPEDPRRGGSNLTLSDRSDLLRTYGAAGPAPSESTRVLQQHQTMSQFGLVGGLNNSDLVHAQMVDMLMQRDQSLTRAQARVKAQRMLGNMPIGLSGALPALNF